MRRQVFLSAVSFLVALTFPFAGAGAQCPQAPGSYVLTQGAGGTLTVGPLAPFPFPAGGTIVQDVSPGDANCVHDVVVPYPGGFNSPIFCIAALGFWTSVVQQGCGVGLVDSDGGSDFTVVEVGDTSDTNGACGLPHPGCTAGADSNQRVDVTLGDGVPDSCTPPATGNSIVSIPVLTTTWASVTGPCFLGPDPDGQYTPGVDSLVVQFAQILDFTTDTNTTSWADIDGDACSLAGAGPPGGFGPVPGSCIDFTAVPPTVITSASGTIGSAGVPLFDLSWTTTLPNTIAPPAPPLGATCSPGPPIDLSNRGAPGPTPITRCCQGTAPCFGPPPDHYKCYKAKETKKRCFGDVSVKCKVDADCEPTPGGPCLGFRKGVTVDLNDQFEAGTFDVKKPRSICTPVDKDGEGIVDGDVHMKRYQIKAQKGAPKHVKQTVLATDQYGPHVIQTVKADSLLVPTLKSLSPGDPGLPANHDHYKCYKAKEVKKVCTGDKTTKCKVDADCATAGGTCYLGFPKGVQAHLLDQLEEKDFDLKKLKLFCTPVCKNGGGIADPVHHLVGYQIKVPKGGAKHSRVQGIYVNNQLGPEVLSTVKEEFLFVPATKSSPSGAFLQVAAGLLY